MAAACTHVAIHARGVERAVDFYRRYAGLQEVHRRVDGEVTVVWMGEEARETKFVIVLLSAEHEEAVNPAPLAHLGYAVASRDEVDRLATLAREEGILVHGPADGGPVVGYLCIVSDPDGNPVEFSHGQSIAPADH